MTGAPYRILVAGSRDWDDWRTVAEALTEAAGHFPPDAGIVVVHGGCRTGADDIAGTEAALRGGGWRSEIHPARWAVHGRKAGPARNAEMVSLGADVVLVPAMPCTRVLCAGKPPHDSHGTADCAAKAQAAGIPGRRFTAGGTS